MERRDFIRKAGTGGLALGLTGMANESAATGTYADQPRGRQKPLNGKKFNILYIHSHDTGRYIQPYGYPVPTPNLQKLAGEGVMFRNYHTTHPTCSASRASLLTGMIPHHNGMIGLAHRGFSLKDPRDHIVNLLKEHGYITALSGVQHVMNHKEGDPAPRIGYDLHIGTADVAEIKAAEWLDNAPQEPFFLSVGFVETHRKYPLHNFDINAGRVIPPDPMPDVPEVREDMARFMEDARILDTKMGKVLAALRRNGLEDNTLVICTTDHGISFPDMKCNLYDGGTGIFLIMRGPGGFQGGRVIEGLVSVIDIFPTLCELLDIERPERLDGISMLPLITGNSDKIRDAVFSQVNYHASYEPVRAIRTERYKYIRRYDKRLKPVLPNCDDGLSKRYWLDHGWKDQKYQREELYDLVFDPHERNNLALSKDYKTLLEKMSSWLDSYMKETDDPLQKGYIAAPPDAILNDADDIDPSGKTYKASELYDFCRPK